MKLFVITNVSSISCHSAMDIDSALSEVRRHSVSKECLKFSKLSHGCSAKKINEKHHEKNYKMAWRMQNSPDQGAK